MQVSTLLGRVLLASIFIGSGLVKLVAAADVRDVLVAHYLPVSPGAGMAVVLGSGLLELAGGALLALGLRTRWAVALLVLTLIPATVFYHFSVGEEDQVVHLLKNASILGGLLLAWGFGPGPISLDARPGSARGR